MTTATRIPNEEHVPPPPPAAPPSGRRRQGTGDNAATTGTATSRAGLLRPAVRKAALARLALSGASGSGKTWTALSIAERLIAGQAGKRVAVIDTEPGDGRQGAAELYADRFRFETLEWLPPFDPRDLALTIRDYNVGGGAALPEGSVLIIDSASHFWRGEGGTLDIAGGRYTGWKTATPAQDDLVDAILRSTNHVIVCTRAKQDYAQQVGADGRQEVVKLGLNPIQRDDLEYEFQVVVMLDQQHTMEVGKTRAAPLAGRKFSANHQGEFAEVYAEWLGAGQAVATMVEVDGIRAAVMSCPDPARRQTIKREFKAAFGEPEHLVADRVPEAFAWLKERGLPEAPPPPAENIAAAKAEVAAAQAAQAAQDAPPPPPHKLAAEDAEEGARARLAAAQAARDEAVAVVEEVANEGAQAMTEEEVAYALGAQDGADARLEHAEAEVAAAEAEVAAVTVETLRERIAAIEGKATGHAAPAADEEAGAVEAEAARWVAIWTECSNMRLTDLSAACAEAGLPAGGNKAALVERLAKHRYGA